MSMRACVGGIIGLVLAATWVGCQRENTFAPPPPPAVTVATPVRDEVVVYREFTGRTAPAESVEIRARVSGLLERIHFTEGDPIEARAPLYDIERAPYEAALEAARAELAKAEATVAEAQFDLDKVKDLEPQGIASKQELVIAEAKYESAVATSRAAAASVREAELNLGYTHITAPLSGRINQSRVDVGNFVGRNEPTLLTTIVPWDPIHVYFTVGERDVLEFRRQAIRQGEQSRDHVEVYLQLADGSAYPLPGHVDYVDNRVDPNTGTIRVRAVFENPDELLVPGIFARVRVPRPPRVALLVPEVALQRDLAGYFLLTVDDDNIVVRRDVEVAESLGALRVVRSGLADDAQVIINGLQRARPGGKVNPQPGSFAHERRGPSGPTSASPVSAPATTQQTGDE